MIKISKAKISDIDDIQKVRKAAWLIAYPNEKLGITLKDLESEFEESPEESIVNRKRREGWMINPLFHQLVARDGEEVVGFFVGEKSSEINRIRAIYVLPNYQKKGIGKKLMEKGLEWLGKDKDILINVASYNLNAQGFYKRFGFEYTGRDATDTHSPLKTGKVIPEIEMKKVIKPHSA